MWLLLLGLVLGCWVLVWGCGGVGLGFYGSGVIYSDFVGTVLVFYTVVQLTLRVVQRLAQVI
ncbi:hypothetical protein RA281_27505, partial [Pseudomonas syringae pv. tagetis]